jgi:endoribonuclease Dicer
VVADVLEAVLGAAFLSGGDRIAIQTIRALQLPFPHIQRLEDLKRRASTALARATQSLPVGASRAVEQIFQAHFGHSGLIARALVRSRHVVLAR